MDHRDPTQEVGSTCPSLEKIKRHVPRGVVQLRSLDITNFSPKDEMVNLKYNGDLASFNQISDNKIAIPGECPLHNYSQTQAFLRAVD